MLERPFTVLGVSAAIGRALTPDDDIAGARPVAVLGDALWKRHFGGDVSVIGRETKLDGVPTLIVGVMPPTFDFPVAGTELWVPLRLSRTQPPNRAIPPESYRQYRILSLVGRLAPDVSVERARLEATTIATRLERSYPEANRNTMLAIVPLQETMVAAARPALLILLAAVGCVLLIACATSEACCWCERPDGRARSPSGWRSAPTVGGSVRQMLTESSRARDRRRRDRLSSSAPGHSTCS